MQTFKLSNVLCKQVYMHPFLTSDHRRLYRRRHYRCVVNPGLQNNKPALFESRPNCLEFSLYIYRSSIVLLMSYPTLGWIEPTICVIVLSRLVRSNNLMIVTFFRRSWVLLSAHSSTSYAIEEIKKEIT